MRTLVIIPAYNEENNLENLINQLKSNVQNNTDFIIINDNSTDTTLTVIHKLGVKAIDLPCNLGIGGAVQTGYKYARKYEYDIAIQVDGDGQHDPKYIQELIEPIVENKADLVIGSRYIEKKGFQSSLLRRVGIKYFSGLINMLTGQVITDPTSGYRACNKKVIEQFTNYYPTDYPEPESIVTLLRKGFVVKELPVIMFERQNGRSSIDIFKSVYYVFKVSISILIDALRGSWKLQKDIGGNYDTN